MWESRDQNANPDLIGVHGDLLFGDPLGIRANSAPRSQNNNGQGYSRGGAGAPPRSDSPPARSPPQQHQAGRAPYANREDEDDVVVDRSKCGEEGEDWGPVGQFFWYVIAGGKQCCSMRDRAVQAEAAKKAAATGRPPPQSQFPEPQAPVQGQRARARDDPDDFREAPPSGKSPCPPPSVLWTKEKAPQPAPETPKLPPQRRADSDSDESDSRFRREQQRERRPSLTPPPGGGYKPNEILSKPKEVTPPQPSPSRPVRDPCSTGAFGGSSIGKPSAQAKETPPKGHMPKRWEWPPWCLNFKTPCIEVYVEDEETRKGRWVEAEPQSRVVDKSGVDAYLCVEYEWDGEFYVQDFGPQHVRRRGQTMTVFALFDQDQDNARNGGKDNGGGVAAFLSD